MRARLTFVLALTALLSPAAGQEDAPKRGQEVFAEEAIRDHDYLFELHRPRGTEWRLLAEGEARELTAEAVAALARSPDPVFGAIVIEATPQGAGTLEGMASLIVQSMPLGDKKVESQQAITFKDLPAIRIVVRGTNNGVPLRYVNTIVNHRGFTYQIVGGGALSNVAADGSTFEPLWAAFRFLPGERVLGRKLETVQSGRGVGWRVVDGRFESAASGLIVPPLEGWRTAIDADLDGMSTSAEVGLVGNAPQVFATFIDEPVGMNADALEAYLRQLYTDSKGCAPDGEVTLSMCGRDVAFTRRKMDVSGLRFEFLHGVLLAEGRAVQVEAWWAADTTGALEALRAALAQVQLAPAAARERLAAELLAEGDPQSFVGETWSVRRGVLRDFDFDLRWKKPSALWSVDPPTAEQGEYARAQLSQPSCGVYGLLAAERAEGLEPLQFHDVIISMVCPDGRRQGEPQKRKVGAQDLFVSFIDQDGEVPLTYVIVTALAGERAIRLVLWGLQAHVVEFRAQFLAAVDALQVDAADLVSRKITGDVLRDERMGYSFDAPGAGWRVRDSTPAEIRAVGTFTTFEKAGRMVGLVVVHPTQGQGQVWVDRMMAHGLKQLSVTEGGTPMAPTPMTVNGITGTRRGVRDAKGTIVMEVVQLQRDGVVLMITAAADAGNPGLDEALQGLQWID